MPLISGPLMSAKAEQYRRRISIGRISPDLRVNSDVFPETHLPPHPPESNTRLPFSTPAEKQSLRLKPLQERSVYTMGGWRLITRRSGWQTVGGGGGGGGHGGGGDLHIKGPVLPSLMPKHQT